MDDTTIIYSQNWNFCFYTGNSVIEGRNATDDKILFLSRAGRNNVAENLILVSSKYYLTEDITQCYNAEGYIQGQTNEFCISSDFRKLCGKDTLEIDFWLSDPRFIIGSCHKTILVEPRLFLLNKRLGEIPPNVYNQIPLLTPKDLHIFIKNPPPLFEKSNYYGHFYQCADSSSCEKKYMLTRSILTPK